MEGARGKLTDAACALYEPQAAEEELNAFGFSAADYGDEAEIEVWPCCWDSVDLFSRVVGQWRVSAAGAYALDYVAVQAVMDMRQIGKKRRRGLFDDIQIMESAVLAVMREWAQ